MLEYHHHIQLNTNYNFFSAKSSPFSLIALDTFIVDYLYLIDHGNCVVKSEKIVDLTGLVM